MSNVKNYTEQGGEKTVIGGTLEIKQGASVTGLPAVQLPAATEITFGGIKAVAKTEAETVAAKIGADGNLYVSAHLVAANQSASTAEDVAGLLADFNALLVKLKAAGIMAADA